MTDTKPIHTVVLDTGSIIKNDPSASTLMSQAESIMTVPAIIAEIKDAATRARYETTLRPFVTLRSPQPRSIQFVTDFARKTGDLAVLSKPDIQIIALTYEVECEKNGGDWRLRRTPGQKGTNGAPPKKIEDSQPPLETQPGQESNSDEPFKSASLDTRDSHADSVKESQEPTLVPEDQGSLRPSELRIDLTPAGSDAEEQKTTEAASLAVDLVAPRIVDETEAMIPREIDSVHIPAAYQDDTESESDSDGWITPSNLKKQQATDAASSTKQASEPTTMQVAVVTTDFAMQNVILQMNLNLLSPSMYRIKRLNTYVLRCHACFSVCKDLGKQFCPRCGQATLTRVACSTSSSGEFRLHLKKNMQWNHRGDRYSIPKPVHGSPHGRIKGGGKGGWGNDLMLAEDQKEYQNASREQRREKEKNLMDEDYLPSILSGDRGKAGGRIKVGAGRNVNSRKR